jgi:hypothetical protein
MSLRQEASFFPIGRLEVVFAPHQYDNVLLYGRQD